MNKIEKVMKQGLEEFIKGNILVSDEFKAHQKDLLDAVVAEVKEVDTYTGDDLADKCTEEVKSDIEALINNSTGV